MGKGQRSLKEVLHQPPLSSADILMLPVQKQDSGVDLSTQPIGLYKKEDCQEELTEHAEKVPLIHLMTTYLSYLILIITGHIRDFVLRILKPEQFKHLSPQNGYAPINSGFGKQFWN
jgi:hypothetical protein